MPYYGDKEILVEIEESVRGRELSGFAGGLGKLLLIAIPLSGMFFLLNVPQYIGWLVFNEQYMGLFLGLGLCATYILIPAKPTVSRDSVPWYDILAALAGMAVGLYVFVFYPSIVNSLGDISTERVILGCVTILLLAEASRRLVGWPLVIIAGCFLLYAYFAYMFPGDFYGKGWSINRLATYLYLDANGIFGQALQVGVSIVIVFVIFGEVLYVVGGAEFLQRFFAELDGALSRRPGEDRHRVVEFVRQHQRQRGGQRRGRRRVYDSDDEKSRVSGAAGGGDRSHRFHRRADHAAGDGRRGVFDRGVFANPLCPSGAGRGGSSGPLLCRVVHPGRSLGGAQRYSRPAA